jgi:hypothetical protein
VSITGWRRVCLFSLPRCPIDAELDESGAGHGEAGPDAVETLGLDRALLSALLVGLCQDRTRDARIDHGQLEQHRPYLLRRRGDVVIFSPIEIIR